ncbi:rhodanese-like domain-containing protein [Desulfogranum mediterraneum]|uniref:rhodanese-like domain-containing protein n=1 Tax=Desulfogranum mediterraneum TaxID=160661 RepID=UPI000420F0A9|nr:rhodanese-like domain-containing protein [Desulfogranum mediterraneum]
MKKKFLHLALPLLLLMLSLPAALSSSAAEPKLGEVSGAVRQGYRVLTIPGRADQLTFTVYRGDYIKFQLEQNGQAALLSVPALAIEQKVPSDYRSAPFFKMKKVGIYPFTLGLLSGQLRVIEYDRPQYQVLSAEEAGQLIANLDPLILDVRSRKEYLGGHLENSIHIPLQQLQQRYRELSAFQGDNILIYCASGNRSTVAAKILIDRGFKRIYNLQGGVHGWSRSRLPLVR